MWGFLADNGRLAREERGDEASTCSSRGGIKNGVGIFVGPPHEEIDGLGDLGCTIFLDVKLCLVLFDCMGVQVECFADGSRRDTY